MSNRIEMFVERRTKGILLKDIATSIGVSIQLLSAYERGTKNMSEKNVINYNNYIRNYNK